MSSESALYVHPASPSERKTRVLVLFGGRSGEHAISAATAAGVMRAIDRSRYDVIPVGITPRGQWVLVSDDPDQWDITGGELPQVTDSGSEVVLPMSVDHRELRVLRPEQIPEAMGQVDVVFPLLHGPYGEDGTLQGLLELANIRYVGSGVLASAVGMDKHFMKIVLAGHGIPVGPYVTIPPGRWESSPQWCQEAVSELGLPVFVKPARAGSSLGITKVTHAEEFPAAMATALQHDPKVIVEAQLVGREIECAVLGGRGTTRPRASLPGEIQVTNPKYDFYDFDAKYLDAQSVQLSCPADLPPQVTEEVQRIAVRTFEAVSAEGLSRVDVFVTPDEKVVVNEINTMPGFTPFSMYPQMWQASGMDYAELIGELIELALERPMGLR